MTFTALVLGGAGVFGGRICRRLARHDGISVIAAGRHRAPLEALAAESGGRIEPLAFDMRRDLGLALAKVKPDLVIHTAGPFQGQDYTVAERCITERVHYVDIADGRDFVARFVRLDPAARAVGVLAVSGASSVPSLSAAAIDSMLPAFGRIERIEIALSPGNRAPRGPAVIAAFLGYSGRPFTRWENGAWRTVYGWHDLRRFTIDGLGPRWLSACDVPDLALFPERYPGVGSVTFHAGLDLEFLHFGLWLLAWLPRLRLVRSLSGIAAFAELLGRVTRHLGGDRGGMAVTLAGRDREGGALARRWSLVAGSGHGPFVPAIPAVLLARKLAHGALSERGARPCLGLFTLKEFRAEVADLDIADGMLTLPA